MPEPVLAALRWPRRTERLRLRPATLDDVDAIHAYRGRPDVSTFLSRDALSRDEVVARVGDRIARATLEADRPVLGIAVEDGATGRLVGDVMLALERSQSITSLPTDEWEGVIGYAFHPDVHGRGFASEAASELLALAFRELGLRRVRADAFADNVASNRVLAKIGMRLEGTKRQAFLGEGGVWLDLNDWSILRDEWTLQT
ncbi:acetyltransferase [Intrasporangium oryzae NRRL B-24470]|uniref:Acetyltransferase n=1 Tax=Intrasporangium oryzae NRRL B-24470 TaxID=1386089 RepID=W9GIC1_9MICO|nr:GNAT family protein [Intrasporangium oryzae]EWT03629.1 acetyltransferase [Intrasporangium oryzae NRRL B-24470]